MGGENEDKMIDGGRYKWMERTNLNGILPGIHPEDVVGQDIDGQVARVADAGHDDRSSVGAVEQGLFDLRILAVVDPVEEALDGVDGDLSRSIGSRLQQDHAVVSFERRHLDERLVREDVRKVHVS